MSDTPKETYLKTQKLFHIILRVPKAHSSFLYFSLEANEGICFYSTLDHQTGDTHRDIDLYVPIEFKGQFENFLNHFKKEHEFEILKEEEILDESPQI